MDIGILEYIVDQIYVALNAPSYFSAVLSHVKQTDLKSYSSHICIGSV